MAWGDPKSGAKPPRRPKEGLADANFKEEFKQYVLCELEALLTEPGLFPHEDVQEVLNEFKNNTKINRGGRITQDLFARCSNDVRLPLSEYFQLRKEWCNIPIPPDYPEPIE